MKTPWGLITVLVLGAWGTRAGALDITGCGQTVPDRTVGVLTGDLDCPASSTGVTLGYTSTLDLNGHTIVAPQGWAVWCNAATKCAVRNGEIHGAETGVYLGRGARLTATNLVVRDCHIGVEGEDWNNGRTGTRATLINVQITGSEGAAVLVGRLKADTVTIDNNPGDGILGTSTSSVVARQLTVTGNAFSAGCDVYGCEGINVGQLKGAGLLVSGNAGVGIHAVTVSLRDSTVVDNIRAGSRKDLVVAERPHVRNVTCGVSLGWGSQSSVNWGVCEFDNVP